MEEPEYYDLFLKQSEMENFLFAELTKLGYVPSEDEIEDIAELMFFYFMNLLESSGVVTTIDYNEGEE